MAIVKNVCPECMGEFLQFNLDKWTCLSCDYQGNSLLSVANVGEIPVPGNHRNIKIKKQEGLLLYYESMLNVEQWIRRKNE